MLKQATRLITWYVLLAVASVPMWAQFGLGKHKEPSDKPPEYSENDKKKLVEIEQRPEVQDEIEYQWEQRQRDDQNYAYFVNSSLHFGEMSGPQYAEFRRNYAQLYDNPILQQYINRIGQRLVPPDSPHVYSFKLLLDPIPQVEALSTGTIYVTTGLVSLLDNEAQLAYVLGHEIAHVEKNHRYNMIKNAVLESALNEEKEKSAREKRGIMTAVGAVAGAGLGGIFGGGRGAGAGLLLGGLGGYVSSLFVARTNTTVTNWSEVDENEADEAGFKYMLDQNYDVREVPRVYARLQGQVTKDARVGLGFFGKPSRLKERSSHIQTLISNSYKATIDGKVKSLKMNISSADFPVLMAALKCDNGIIALDYDLFAMSRDNLEEAVALRSRYPRAESYLGKVIALTARTQEDQQQAMEHFAKAIQYDSQRGVHYEAHLERALFLIERHNTADADEIRRELQTYVALYQREHRGSLPAHMAVLYDYFSLEGDSTWYVAPENEVSTRYSEPLNVNNAGNTGAPGVKQVMDKAVEKRGGQSVSVTASDPQHSSTAHKKNVSGTTSPE